jgi:putative ABC transport system permease protein
MVNTISWFELAWCLPSIFLVTVLFIRWQGNGNDVLIASGRMIVQLIAVGYVLAILFAQPSLWISLSVMAVMLVIATWIALRPVRQHKGLWLPALLALGVSVFTHLFLSLGLIINVTPIYSPSMLIPLAGMYFANTMNTISLAAERFFSELSNGKSILDARNIAFHAAMIPQINGLLAVGIVALPGMMTGQILSGVSPLIAVRYQIMIMAMVLGTTGVGAAIMLWQLFNKSQKESR